MQSSKFSYHDLPDLPSTVVREDTIEYGFIGAIQGLKYEYRRDITDRATLEQNFHKKFDELNHNASPTASPASTPSSPRKSKRLKPSTSTRKG